MTFDNAPVTGATPYYSKRKDNTCSGSDLVNKRTGVMVSTCYYVVKRECPFLVNLAFHSSSYGGS